MNISVKHPKSGATLLLLIITFFTVSGISSSLAAQITAENNSQQPVDLVDPLIDSANSRWFFFSSACRPFGMVNLSPDNLIEGTWGTGYRYNENFIRGFSHIHAWQLSGISVLPVKGEIDPRKGADDYGSPFSHENEIAKPGYHKVLLDKYGITVELTSTTRVGFQRYTFPVSTESKILFNLGGPLGPAEMVAGMVRVVNSQEMEGYTVNGKTPRRPKECPVYFVAQFSKAFQQMDGWQASELYENIKQISGEKSGVILNFSTKQDEVILLKVAISYVSIEQARINLLSELGHWDFDRIKNESREDWNNWLGKIKVEGGTHVQRVRFYTDLWHALQGRRIISDVNGKYSDMTGPERKIKQIPLNKNSKPKFNHYNSDSFWGAQWTLNTLWHLVYPQVSEEFCNSMLMMYQDGGLIPRGPSGGNYTYVMTGASTTPFIVSAYMKGITGFDIHLAYEGMRKNHFPGGMMSKAGYEHDTFLGGGIEYYIKNGFVPYPLPVTSRVGYHMDGGGQTLEYAYQDWCLAQMARALGNGTDYELFMERALNYKNLYDPSSGWMRPKKVDGSWFSPFDPLAYEAGWVESTAVQASWFVPHDVQGLIELMGSCEKFTDKLDHSFKLAQSHNFVALKTQDREETNRNRRTYLNYGNQPAMQVAYLFNYSGAPWLTQFWAREVIKRVYSDVTPQSGYNGDEDQGLMGALSVLMKMGLFSMRGGTALRPVYEISSPVFDKIIIELDSRYYPGKKFIIETINNSETNRFIQSAKINGQQLTKAWFYHDDLIKGGKLVLELGSTPNKEWGSRPEDAPPSLTLIK